MNLRLLLTCHGMKLEVRRNRVRLHIQPSIAKSAWSLVVLNPISRPIAIDGRQPLTQQSKLLILST